MILDSRARSSILSQSLPLTQMQLITLSRHCPSLRLWRESRYTRCSNDLCWVRSRGFPSGQLVPRFTLSKLNLPVASLVACSIVFHFFSITSQIFLIYLCWGMSSLGIDRIVRKSIISTFLVGQMRSYDDQHLCACSCTRQSTCDSVISFASNSASVITFIYRPCLPPFNPLIRAII